MKKLTNFLKKIRGYADREFVLFTGAFFLMMMVIYVYMIFEVGTDTPKFTYAEF